MILIKTSGFHVLYGAFADSPGYTWPSCVTTEPRINHCRDTIDTCLMRLCTCLFPLGFPGGSWERVCLPMWEMSIWTMGWEQPLDKQMATHSSILAWHILRTEEPGGLLSVGPQRDGHDWATKQQRFPLLDHRNTMAFLLSTSHSI